MKLDLCIGEALSYMHVTIETAFVGVAINYHYYYILFYSTILLVSNYEISIFHTWTWFLQAIFHGWTWLLQVDNFLQVDNNIAVKHTAIYGEVLRSSGLL